MRETHRAKKFLAVMLQKYFLQGMGSLWYMVWGTMVERP
jgi:hypothetical protein